MSGDPRLAGWHHLLPDALLFREDGGPPLAVDAYRPATDLARVLTRSPHRFEAALGAALAAISPLHQHTGQITVVNHTHLEQWVDRPLEELRRMCQTLAPVRFGHRGRHLGVLLHQALAGQRVAVSWTHGDFTPANVLFDGVQVSGIVDWGGARRDWPAVLDVYLMLITARCQVERLLLGPIVVRLLRAGGLGQREHDLLEQFWCFPRPRDRARTSAAAGVDPADLGASFSRAVPEMRENPRTPYLVDAQRRTSPAGHHHPAPRPRSRLPVTDRGTARLGAAAERAPSAAAPRAAASQQRRCHYGGGGRPPPLYEACMSGEKSLVDLTGFARELFASPGLMTRWEDSDL